VFAENEFDDDENVVRLRNVSTSKTRARVLRSYSTFFSAVSRLEMVGTSHDSDMWRSKTATASSNAMAAGLERHARSGPTKTGNGVLKDAFALCATPYLRRSSEHQKLSFIQSRHSTSSVGGVH
jgi:hypothetical protein